MISGWGLLIVSLAYVCGLFLIAWWGDKRRFYPEHTRLRPVIYSLALAVYCSSWTFYGAVGTAVRTGLGYLPIYLGPLLLFVFLLPFFERLVRMAKQQNATSISDLLAARFGRSSRIAVMVTVIALTAAIPYIALQLKAIAMSINVLTASSLSAEPMAWYRDSTLVVALMLALFSSLFGARQVDATEHHPGMVLAVAAESVVKLIALLCVALFAMTQLDGAAPLLETIRSMPARVDHSISFFTQTLLSMTAIFCLPRQFQIGVVECADARDVRHARWWFSGYLALVIIVVVPIAAVAIAANAGEGNISPDSFVLWLPLSGGQDWLALLAYLGGFSAATGMVIVATVALATMVSNDLVLPAVWRWRPPALGDRSPASGGILWIRRAAILGILLAAYVFFRAVPNGSSLASIGLLAFAAVAQFAPAVICAVYWSGASRAGVLAGLTCGFLIWIYTLLLPTLVTAGGEIPAWISVGPFGIGVLAPHSLLGFGGADPLTHGVFWSLLANVAALVGMSLYSPPAIGERLQLTPPMSNRRQEVRLLPGSATVADLQLLAQRLLGDAASYTWLQRHSLEQGREYVPTQRADVGLLQSLERELAGALGAASARMVLTSALRGAGLQFSEVVTLFDEASQKLRFNRELLEAMMENMPQGISVVDADLRLVAWNRRYVELLRYPPEMMRAGRPIADFIRFNAERGWYGPGDKDHHVDKRLAHMRAGSMHLSERRRNDGRVIEVRGQPLPDGGYVSTFNDVTMYKHVEDELREINETLEQRVAERTRQLAEATTIAEKANLGKTRFLAAASHDLLQPLNAARLFNAALRGQAGQLPNPEIEQLADRVENSLHAAEELLDGLLDISRLDSGAIQPERSHFSAGTLLDSLKEQFAPIAAQRNLDLRVRATKLHVHSDHRMLRRVLQNLIGNALRYTRSGRVVVGCRRRGDSIEFQVIDTGPGIAAESQGAIFEEFRRLDQQSPWGERGLGLGLSICDRIARILRTQLTLKSTPGRGSAFCIQVPRGSGVQQQVTAPAPTLNTSGLKGLKVLCIEDDPDILDAMRELLTRWEIEIFCTATAAEARKLLVTQSVDLILADYHLGDEPLGLDLLDELVAKDPSRLRAGALVTADGTAELAQRAHALGFQLLRKPLRPAALRALMVALVQGQSLRQ